MKSSFLPLFMAAVILTAFSACKKDDPDPVVTPDITSNLVAFYPFEGDAEDEAGTNNAVVDGPTLTAGVNNSANSAYLFGTDKRIYVNDSLISIKDDFTISFWVYMNSFNTSENMEHFITNRINALTLTEEGGITIGHSNQDEDTITVYFHQPTFANYQNIYSSGNTSIDIGKWYSIVLQRSGNTVRLYVDGVKEAEEDLVITTYTGNTWTFGGIKNASTGILREVQGKLDQIRFYDRALTEEQISYLFNNKL